MQSISKLFTKKNIEILLAIKDEEHSVRDVSEIIRCSPGKVNQAVQIYTKKGIIKTRKEKNRLMLSADKDNPLYQKMMALINTNSIISTKGFKELTKLGDIGVYGSYAKGTDDTKSDIDLLLITDKGELEARKSIRNIEKELGKNVSPLVMTKEGIMTLMHNDPSFGIRLKNTLTILHGDPLGR